MLGDGERACMSMARFGQEVIASSNFRDVAPYCDENGIEYIGTLDVLTIAMNKGILPVMNVIGSWWRQRRKTKRNFQLTILLFIRLRNTSVRFDSE